MLGSCWRVDEVLCNFNSFQHSQCLRVLQLEEDSHIMRDSRLIQY